MTARQLAFDLEPRPALGEEDFLVAPCNAEAVAWIDRFPEWPAPALIVSGDEGSGKTHLARVFMAKTGGREIPFAGLSSAVTTPLGSGDALVIEDAARIAGDDPAEEALFHLYNRARDAGAELLLTASAPASRWNIRLPDLASRLRAAPSVLIGAPDDSLLAAVLVKQFADRQLRIDEDVLNYVVPRIERSFAAVGRFVKDTDRLALERKRRITVPLARKVLEG